MNTQGRCNLRHGGLRDCGGGVSSGYKYAIPMGLWDGESFGYKYAIPMGLGGVVYLRATNMQSLQDCGGGESSGYKYAILTGLICFPLHRKFITNTFSAFFLTSIVSKEKDL